MERSLYFCKKCKKVFSMTSEAVMEKCPNCGQVLLLSDYPVSEWRKLQDAEKERIKEEWATNVESLFSWHKETKNILVTTCDLKEDYDIIGPVFIQINDRGNQFATLEQKYAGLFEAKSTNGQMSEDKQTGLEVVQMLFLSAGALIAHDKFDKAFFIAVEELKARAFRLNADAIIGMRYDLDLDTNGFQYFYLQMYGTAVKRRQLHLP